MAGKLDWSSGGFAKREEKKRDESFPASSLSPPLPFSPAHIFPPPSEILRSE